MVRSVMAFLIVLIFMTEVGATPKFRIPLLQPPIVTSADEKCTITSPFGWRTHPIHKKRRKHYGVDVRAKYGTPYVASAAGIVKSLDSDPDGCGTMIEIYYPAQRACTVYCHLSKYADGIHEGARVRQGQKVGEVGATGGITGPHAHVEVTKNCEPPAGHSSPRPGSKSQLAEVKINPKIMIPDFCLEASEDKNDQQEQVAEGYGNPSRQSQRNAGAAQ